MSTTGHGTLTRESLVRYFLDAAKPRAAWRIGIEVEKMGRLAASGGPLPFDGPGPSVVAVLEALRARRGGTPVLEGGNPIGIEADWGTISLEPGGQVEWSSVPYRTLGALARALQTHLKTLDEIGRALGIRWLDVGVDPELPLSAMAWVPKSRYAIMRPYLASRGRLAERMMSQTASIQCAFDFGDAEDWRRKFKAAALMTPAAIALFANSSVVDGAESHYRSYRQRIWRETDPDRSALPSIVFEPGFDLERWAGWTLEVPTIFRDGPAGRVAAHGVPFERFLEESGPGAPGFQDLVNHLSTVFTDVRAYTYIEVRSADLLPDERILDVPAFWTGILYHDGALSAALELGAAYDRYDLWRAAREAAALHGVGGEGPGAAIRELAGEALAIAIRGLREGAAGVAEDMRFAARLERLAERHGFAARPTRAARTKKKEGDDPMSVAEYLKQNRERHLEELKTLLAIPSVSTDPQHKADVARAADWVAARLERAGCTRVETHPTAGHPIVYGEWLGAPGRPTILVYGHYDVQPPDPLDEWESPPFEPTIRAGRLYARGASDDKGQVIVHVNALEAHLANGGAPVNVKFLIEGEEEIGSPNLVPFLRRERQRLACDAVVVSDTAMFGKGVPSICYGLRGLTYLEVHVEGSKQDLHSGTFGGSVVNPANALVTMLASLKDRRGRITIPGFYDDVRPLERAERKAFASLPHSDERYRRALGAPELSGEAGFSTLERIWGRPTLDINGIWGGFTKEGAKTVIPAVARAKISMRLVPDQKPGDIARKVARHLKEIAPCSVRVRVENLHGGDAWMTETDHPAMQAAGRAMRRAFGRDVVFVREGGSIPIVAEFDRMLKVPAVLLGIGLNDDNLHSPNEKLDLSQFYRGIEAAAYLMEELGRDGATSAPRKAARPKPKSKPKRGRRAGSAR